MGEQATTPQGKPEPSAEVRPLNHDEFFTETPQIKTQ
jgi:hypothetical protein